MRLHFQERPWDVVIAVGYTLVIATALLASGEGNLLAILLVFFVPGYLLNAALFPGNEEIEWIERIILSIGLSIAVVPLLGLLLNFTPLGIRFAPIVATIALFTAGVGYVAYWRRMRLTSDRRLSLTVTLAVPEWKEYSAVDKSLTIALAAAIFVAGGTLLYIVATPRSGLSFTEFYILGPGGTASGYPTNLSVNESGTVIIGVVSHESATVNYTIRVDLVGVRIVHNATVGSNQTIEVNRTTWSWFNTTVRDGANWTHRYTFSIPKVGLWRVQFLLFKNGDFTSAYRELHSPLVKVS